MALDQSCLSELLDAVRSGGDLDFMRKAMEFVLQSLIDLEAAQVIGAGRYERTDGRTTHRNGTRPRLLSTKAGDVNLQSPKLRQGSFFPSLLEPRRRIDRALWAVVMTPTPLQSPRIPIWIGADSRNRAPWRRAARWDGFVPASDSWPEGVIYPAEYEAIVADIGALRPQAQTGPFDVVVIGNASGTLPTTDSLPAYAAAGVTWVLSQALSVDEARRRIASGPPGAPTASTR